MSWNAHIALSCGCMQAVPAHQHLGCMPMHDAPVGGVPYDFVDGVGEKSQNTTSELVARMCERVTPRERCKAIVSSALNGPGGGQRAPGHMTSWTQSHTLWTDTVDGVTTAGVTARKGS